jgi:hypothetical protein
LLLLLLLLLLTESINDRSAQRQYSKLAATCRLPYWDWTRSQLPSLLTAQSVLCLGEDGEPTEAKNPFQPYQYVVSGDHKCITENAFRTPMVSILWLCMLPQYIIIQ